MFNLDEGLLKNHGGEFILSNFNALVSFCHSVLQTQIFCTQFALILVKFS